MLIIWDRLFGTFQEEKDDERVVYGLTHPVRSFNPFWVQFHHLIHVLRTAWELPGLGNKVGGRGDAVRSWGAARGAEVTRGGVVV